jgi:hypothetical protein
VREALLRLTAEPGGDRVTTSETDVRRVRAAKNQSVFRDVNERIEHISEAFDLATPTLDFICECAEETCAERIEMSKAEYEALRRVPTHFAVKPGHEIEGVEEIVDSRDHYVVVAKLGVGGETAAKLDPRSRHDGSPQ